MDYEHELYHYGILGMKWGIRRYQNPDGTLTKEGRIRYGVDSDLRKFVKSKKNSGKTYARSLIEERPDLLFTSDEELATYNKTRSKVLDLNEKLKSTASEEFSEVVRNKDTRDYMRNRIIDRIEDTSINNIHKVSKEEFEDDRLIFIETWLQDEGFCMRPDHKGHGGVDMPKTYSVYNDLQKAWRSFDKNADSAINKMSAAYKDVPLNRLKPNSVTYGDIYERLRFYSRFDQEREKYGGPIPDYSRFPLRALGPNLRSIVPITDSDLDAIITYDEFKKLMKEKYKE